MREIVHIQAGQCGNQCAFALERLKTLCFHPVKSKRPGCDKQIGMRFAVLSSRMLSKSVTGLQDWRKVLG